MKNFNAVTKEHLINTIEAYHRIIADAVCADEIAKASCYCYECKCALNTILEMEEAERTEAAEAEEAKSEKAFIEMVLFSPDGEYSIYRKDAE